jgi:sodium-dependent dicarboxylate transporter 2/3/5
MITGGYAKHRKLICVLLGLLIFILLLWAPRIDPENPKIGRTLAIGVLMAFYWITEAIPLAATALLPVALFPLFGVMKGSEVAPLYLNSIMFLFIGGFVVALAMERWELHKRIALKVILTVGRSPSRLMLGFMTGSWLLSMWISNTATTMMMVPIVMALLYKLDQNGDAQSRKVEIGLLLGVAYAASIGGMATLVGTAPNLSLARIFSMTFPDAPELTFLKWFSFALPLSFVLFVLTFIILRLFFMRKASVTVEHGVLEDEYRSLGTMERSRLALR